MTRLRHRPGFALIAVVWTLAAMASIVTILFAEARSERLAAVNARAAARARWAARGALSEACAVLDSMLTHAPTGQPLRSPGGTVLGPVTFGRVELPVTVTVLDARARLPVNLAGVQELNTLFQAIGFHAAAAAGMAAELVRGRTRDGPFRVVTDITVLLATDHPFFESMDGYLSVFGDGRVNVNSASPAVLATIPGLDLKAASAIAARRARAPFGNPYEILNALPTDARERVREALPSFLDRVAFGPRDLEVVVSAAPAGSPVRVGARGLVRLSGGNAWRLVEVHEW